jgi:hypothetical protein
MQRRITLDDGADRQPDIDPTASIGGRLLP